jgi:hypothetical protein
MWSRELGTIWSHKVLMVIRTLNEKVSCNLNHQQSVVNQEWKWEKKPEVSKFNRKWKVKFSLVGRRGLQDRWCRRWCHEPHELESIVFFVWCRNRSVLRTCSGVEPCIECRNRKPDWLIRIGSTCWCRQDRRLRQGPRRCTELLRSWTRYRRQFLRGIGSWRRWRSWGCKQSSRPTVARCRLLYIHRCCNHVSRIRNKQSCHTLLHNHRRYNLLLHHHSLHRYCHPSSGIEFGLG